MEENENKDVKKKKGVKLYHIIIIFLVVIVALIGVHIYANNAGYGDIIGLVKGEKKEETASSQKEDKTKKDENDDINTTNSNEYDITNETIEEANVTNFVNKVGQVGETTYNDLTPATDFVEGINVTLENSKVYFELTDKAKVESLSIKNATIKRVENQKEEITGFNGKVKKVYFYEEGQQRILDSLAILFLMEDGTVEYISLADALQTTNLKSSGKITGLYNILEIYSATARENVDGTGGPGWIACLAKDSNNNYYDLKIVFNKSNIILSEKVSATNETIEEANVTNFVNKVGQIGETTYNDLTPATDFTEGINVTIEGSKVYFELTDKIKVESLSIKNTTINRVENQKEEITGFNGKVKKVYFYEEGQQRILDSLAILFLMEDGTVEYISLADALQTTNLRSRGKITGLNNIKEIYSATARENVDGTGGPGWVACLAKDSNNNYYDLKIVFDKNNINLSKVN